jgi:uncharacterized protein YjbI with pentapeptide repeats
MGCRVATSPKFSVHTYALILDSSPAATILNRIVRDEECHVGRKEDQANKQSPWWKKLWGWTGFGEKKLWDWLQLLSALAIPVVLAVAGFWFADQQQQQQRKIQQQQAQDVALQAYLSQMGQLILEEDLSDPEQVSEKVRTLARVRTITVLSRLDPNRKHSVMQFLIEGHLVQGGRCCKEPIIALNKASLRDVTFLYAPLEGAYLLDADMSGANLRGAYLTDADLGGADLDEADLSGADLSGADLGSADLGSAHLEGADLSDAGLSGANLRGAYLRDTYLGGADLDDADLSGADLGDADLSDADLGDANLSGAEGITQELLEAQAKTVEGATMPDGQKLPQEPEPPDWGETIPDGEYVIAALKPTFRLKVGKGWLAQRRKTLPTFAENQQPDAGVLTFTNPLQVFDPSNLSEPKKVPGPENAEEWVSWFQRHPNLDISKPVPASVGDESGKRIDVTGTSTPQNYPKGVCDEAPCVRLYPGIVSSPHWKDRFVIVDVEGETVVIDVSAPAGKFDEFLPKAQKVLKSVEWKGG